MVIISVEAAQKERRKIMTALEIDKVMAEIALHKVKECEERLAETPKDNKSERKAIQIELGMYSLCLRAGLLYYTTPVNMDTVQVRKNRFMNISLKTFPKIAQIYEKSSEEEKLRIVAALQGEMFMRDQMYIGYVSELEQAKASGDSKRIFEFTIKTGALNVIFDAWEEWRISNNVYPHMFKEDK